MMRSPPFVESCGPGVLRIAADVDPAEGRLPERIWFEVDAALEPFVRPRADAFAATLLFPAMALGRPLEIRGPCSPRLLEGLRRRMEIAHAWRPDLFTPVVLRADELAPAPEAAGEVVAAFSGGVDAFHTLWSHVSPAAGPSPGGRVTAALFLHGFDIPLEDADTYRRAADAYEEALRPLDVRLLRVRTNARDARRAVPWGFQHGAVLGAAALSLGRFATRFLVPATDNPDGRPWGSHEALDVHLATEALDVVVDGGELDRAGKIASILEWPAALRLLRVCLRRPNAFENCCRCEKCIRTMILLDLAGALDRCPTFPKPLRRRDVRRTRFESNFVEGISIVRSLLRHAVRTRRFDLAFDLCWSVARSRLRPLESPRLRAGRPIAKERAGEPT